MRLCREFCDCQQRTCGAAYSVGNAVCRLGMYRGGVVMVCWIAEADMQSVGLIEDETMPWQVECVVT